ncbi:DUF4177 domain-containing protein [Lacihabitans sp. CCS-44]|jgi:hypothetical protein|uniref:DUF4177 domain-containing protein n=1 Tax=Lacihabitans sp. CCS-44 TaxID=2487331 RepID=UPI0020CD092A|nr:DUF4177 domain-containing protein [Lacihabitans sp. CCS-44]MCP9757551.1 DUF4177 domain-containing protein [Lacihabitans sp. CCS-44]HLO45345.1 DUF4177 domain-containing protein [Leadbetterella sp.]
MKDTKVETLIFYSKFTFDKNHIAKSSQEEIQKKLDEYSKNGYRLISTTSTGFGYAIYIHLFFEKDI